MNSRRSFLKGLFSAGVAASIAKPAAAFLDSTALSSTLDHGVDACGDGWHKVWITGKGSQLREGSFDLLTGLVDAPKTYVKLNIEDDWIEDDKDYTLSAFIKVPNEEEEDGDFMYLYHPQITQEKVNEQVH